MLIKSKNILNLKFEYLYHELLTSNLLLTVAGCAQQSGGTRVNLTNFQALISYSVVAAEGGESSHPPITRVAH